MKKLGKIFALLIAAVMLFSIAAPVFAVGEGQGGSIYIYSPFENRTYAAYQIFDGLLNEDGNGLKLIDWGSGVNGDALLSALQGITEGVLFVPEDEIDGETVPGHSIFADCKNAADVAAVLATFCDGSGDTDVIEKVDAFANIVSLYLTSTFSLSDDNPKLEQYDSYSLSITYKYEIECDGMGYYLVKDITAPESDTEAVYPKYMINLAYDADIQLKASANSIVKRSFRPAKPGEKATHYELTDGTFTDEAPGRYSPFPDYMYKTTEPTHVKVQSGESIIGDVIPYELEMLFPYTFGYEEYTFKVIDNLSKGLTFNDDLIVRCIYYTSYNMEMKDFFGVQFMQYEDADEAEMYEDDEYTIGYIVEEKETSDGGTEITIDFVDLIKFNKIFSSDEYMRDELRQCKIYIQYSATVNEDAVVGVDGNKNGAKLTYSRNPYIIEDKATTPESAVYSYVTEIDITKIDADTQEPITTGAKFEITGTNGYKAEGTTDETGHLKFPNIISGIYTITEVEAPTGYNSLKEPIELRVDWAAPKNPDVDPKCIWIVTSNSAKVDGNGIITLEIENHTGATLPSTGGIGTTIFYVLGTILAVGAVVLLVTKKRMGEDNAR